MTHFIPVGPQSTVYALGTVDCLWASRNSVRNSLVSALAYCLKLIVGTQVKLYQPEWSKRVITKNNFFFSQNPFICLQCDLKFPLAKVEDVQFNIIV